MGDETHIRIKLPMITLYVGTYETRPSKFLKKFTKTFFHFYKHKKFVRVKIVVGTQHVDELMLVNNN